MNASQLRNLLADDGVQTEDLVLARGQLASMDAGYQDLGVQTPEWVTDKLSAINVELVSRNRAEMQRRLKAALARRAGLATAEEKRGQLDAEIAALQQKLG